MTELRDKILGLAELNPNERAWVDSILESTGFPESAGSPSTPLALFDGFQESDEPEDLLWLDSVVGTLLCPAGEKPPAPPPGVDAQLVRAKLAQTCFSLTLSSGPHPSLRSWFLSLEHLQAHVKWRREYTPALIEFFLTPGIERCEPMSEDVWARLTPLIRARLVDPETGLRSRLAVGLAALASQLVPASARPELLSWTLQVPGLPAAAAEELLRRILAGKELFRPYEAGKETVDPRGAMRLGGRSPEERGQEIASVQELLDDELTDGFHDGVEQSLRALQATRKWLGEQASLEFAETAVLEMIPAAERWSFGSGPADVGIAGELGEHLARLAEELGAPSLAPVVLVPAMGELLAAMSVAELQLLHRLAHERRKDHGSSRRRSRKPLSEVEAFLRECAEGMVEFAREDVLPQLIGRVEDLAALGPEELEVVRAELESAVAAVRAGGVVELSPVATQMLHPELPWVMSRRGRTVAPGVGIAAAHILHERGADTGELARTLGKLCGLEDLRCSGPLLGWAVRLVQTHSERFRKPVRELAARIDEATPRGEDPASRLLRFRFRRCDVADFAPPGPRPAVVEIRTNQSLHDLSYGILDRLDLEDDDTYRFRVNGQVFDEEDYGKSGAASSPDALLAELALTAGDELVFELGDSFHPEEFVFELLASSERKSSAARSRGRRGAQSARSILRLVK